MNYGYFMPRKVNDIESVEIKNKQTIPDAYDYMVFFMVNDIKAILLFFISYWPMCIHSHT